MSLTLAVATLDWLVKRRASDAGAGRAFHEERAILGAVKEEGSVEHVALLGDSIFDNKIYTRGEPDVVEHLRPLLSAGWSASLVAIDGSTTLDLHDQIAQLTADVTRAVVSIGGNDALLNADILDLEVGSTREALLLFGERARSFEERYRAAVAAVLARVPRTMLCTIYNGNLPLEEGSTARVALMLFNDAILRVAFERRLDVVDLRLVCSEPEDYANPIEPSGAGGAKIARAIAAALAGGPGSVVRAGR